MLRILVADDHAVVRCGVKEILSERFNNVEFGEAQDHPETLRLAREQEWRLVVLDLTMPGRDGLEVLRDLKAAHPALPVLILSIHPEEQFAVRCLRAGAAGYLAKESAPAELAGAASRILEGGRYISPTLAEKLALDLSAASGMLPHEALSDREYQVLLLIAAGKAIKEIAGELSLSVKTVSTYRSRLLKKMNMKTNADLIRYAVDSRLIV